MELFCKNRQRLKAVNYFCKKAQSQMFDSVLDTLLHLAYHFSDAYLPQSYLEQVYTTFFLQTHMIGYAFGIQNFCYCLNKIYEIQLVSSFKSLQQLAHALHNQKLDSSSLLKVYWPPARCPLLKDDVVFVDRQVGRALF